jgi:uncharacterized protein (TIGR00297 family)
VTTTHSETARQLVHMGSGCFALLLRDLTWWQAAGLACLAVAFNAAVLPLVGGRRLYRPSDHARGFPPGILIYPAAVLVLILAFPTRPDIAAASWGILAFGDGAATLVGRRFRSPALPWNREKTVAGTAAFLVCGGIAGVALAWWTRAAVTPLPPAVFALLAPMVAALAASFIETIPVRLDDNISVPIAAASTLWFASLTSLAAFSSSRAEFLMLVPRALAVNAVVSWLGYRARTVTVAGMVGGAFVGFVIYACAGGAAWLFLFAAFFAATAASRLGIERKSLLGIAEDRGGRRGPGNALANCGVATVAAAAAVFTPYHAPAMVAIVAALTAGGSDTVASEIGKAWGRVTFLVSSLRRVKPGTPGAMSLEGTAAGIVAALGLAALGAALGLIPPPTVVPIVVAATVGALVESALGATLEGPGILNNDMLNFINTAVAAVVALALVFRS